MHSCQLSNIADPLATLFPSKKCPNLVSENHGTAERARDLALTARAHTPLLCVCSVQHAQTSLSFSLSLSASAQHATERSSAFIQLDTDYVASLLFFASIAEITAQVLSCLILCVFDFIRRRCDYHDFFVQINILEGRAGYLV